MPLSVAGAFHTAYMAPAREELEGAGRRPAARPTRAGCCSPTPTAPRSTPAPRRSRRLVSQITSPVRFDACLATLRDLGVTAVDRAAAGRRAGRAGQARVEGRRTIEILALTGPDDLDRARRADRRPSAGAPRPSTSPTGGSSSPRPAARSARPTIAEGTARAGRHPARLRPQPPRGGQRLRRATTGCWPSGSSTTGTWSTPGTRWPVSTRRSRHDAASASRPGAPGARILGLGAYRPGAG